MHMDLPLDKKTAENQDWATRPPGCGAVAGRGPRAAGPLSKTPCRMLAHVVGICYICLHIAYNVSVYVRKSLFL